MSRLHIFFILIIFTASFAQASEKEFWESLADLQMEMLVSEKSSMDLIEKLELATKSTYATSLMGTAFFGAKLDFLEFYSTKEKIKSFLEKNISQIKSSHSGYEKYLSKLAILHFEFGEINKYKKIIEQLKRSDYQIFWAVTELTTTPTDTNFQRVNSYCKEDCNFYLYHKSIANYYAVNGQYQALKTYVINLLNSEYKVGGLYDPIKRINILSYLYVTSKCYEPNKDYLKEIRTEILANTKHLKGSYARINETLDIGCM